MLESVHKSSHGNYYFFSSGSRSDPRTESQGHELSLGQTYDSHDLPGAQILTIRRRWQIASYLRFQSGFVPLWPWGISPSWGTPTWGWPPVQLRRGLFSSPQRFADWFDLWTFKLYLLLKGPLWCSNLCVADPTLLVPVLVGFFFAANVWISSK